MIALVPNIDQESHLDVMQNDTLKNEIVNRKLGKTEQEYEN